MTTRKLNQKQRMLNELIYQLCSAPPHLVDVLQAEIRQLQQQYQDDIE